ncbi:MlaD family protein [Nocardia sp. NPDC003183]
MSFRRSLIGLSLFLVVSLGLIWVTFVTLHRGVDGSARTYSAIFSDVTGLRAGDDVRMAGVRVGRVDRIALVGNRAEVRFRVEEQQKVFGNTKASITYQNVIGQRYLGLSLADFGQPQEVAPGGTIPLEHTEPSFDISVLLNGFEPLFGGLDPQQVDNVTGALITALQGDNTSLVLLIAQVSTLAESVAGPDQVLGAVITNLSQVVGDLAAHSGTVSTLLTQSRSIIDGLSRHRDELMGSLTTVASVTGRLATVVEDVRPPLNEFLTREPGFTKHFEQNKDSFAYLGFNLPALLKGLARASQEGSYLNTYLCNMGVTFLPALATLVPTIVALASPTGAIQQSPICR